MNIVNETLVISEDTINAIKAIQQLQKQQDYLRRCYDLLDALPVKHYAKQKYYTYLLIDDDPLATPADLRIARRLRQRALKWAAKRLLPPTQWTRLNELDFIIWLRYTFKEIGFDPKFSTKELDMAKATLRRLPRSNKPLPLP